MANTYGQCNIVLQDDTSAMSSFNDQGDSFNRKVMIICTMGPSCGEPPMLEKLIENDMNIARLNFSPGDHETHGKTVEKIRVAAAKLPGKPVAFLLDTKGP